MAKNKPKQKQKKSGKAEKGELTALIGLLFVFLLFAVYIVALGYWQIMVLLGNPMANPDGTVDTIANPLTFGFALADLALAIPVAILGIVGMLLQKKWGLFLSAMFTFLMFYMHFAVTASSLWGGGFDVITLEWLLLFPSGCVIAVIFWIWFFNVKKYLKETYGI
ncbi:MAG: hypothetical protein GY771_14200 [bacterium]|nr:hypothetical protein [bacterium]